MDINNQFVVVGAEAECAQAKWVGRTAMRLMSQASVMEVEQVEQVVVPAVKMRGGSSKAVLVTSSTRKVSSDSVGLSNRANECPEGLGSGRGGRGGQVCHRQVEGLGASSTAGQHRRCMRRLQEGGVVAECAYGTSVACTQRKSAKLCCSLAQGQHRQRNPTKVAGSSAVVAVVIEMTKSKLTLLVFPSLTHWFDRWKDSSTISQGWPQQKGCLAHQGQWRERGQGGDDPSPFEGEGVCGAEEDQRQVGGKEDLGCTGTLSQPPPLLALSDPGEGEGVGGRAHHGDVGGERDSGRP